MEKKKIMVVEDERIVARDIARQLTELGYEWLRPTRGRRPWRRPGRSNPIWS